jgi:CubicO group peptidase (beta-lactamase class C family)
MKKSIFILLAIALFSCDKSGSNKIQKTIAQDSSLVHQEAVLNNLKPFHYLKTKPKTQNVEDLMQKYKIPGLRVVFTDKGKISWSKSYGYANLNDSIKVDDKTVFQGASLGKPVTTMAALKLVEQGILNLDEDVNNKLIGWKVPTNEFTKKEKVTLRRLIGHTSGFNRYYGANYMPYEELPTIEQTLRGEKPSKHPAAKLVAVPGEKYTYSNPGYLIIEKLMEDVTGKKFENIIDELVFEPSDMKNSSFEQPAPKRIMATRAIGYSENLQPYYYNNIAFKAAGAISTTPDDLARFTATLLTDHKDGTHKILSQEMTSKVFNRGSRLEKLGFTLFNWDDDISFRHTGQNFGFTSFMFGSVNKEQSLIIMANGVNTHELFNLILNAVAAEYNWDYFKSNEYEPIDVSGKNLDVFTGNFDWNNEQIIITNEFDSLFLQINNERFELIPVGVNTFLAPESSLLVTFPEKLEDEIKTIRIWDGNNDNHELTKMH